MDLGYDHIASFDSVTVTGPYPPGISVESDFTVVIDTTKEMTLLGDYRNEFIIRYAEKNKNVESGLPAEAG